MKLMRKNKCIMKIWNIKKKFKNLKKRLQICKKNKREEGDIQVSTLLKQVAPSID